jgi:uncharacterized membrane protein YccC
MFTETIQQYWALFIAAGLGAGVGLFVAARLYGDSARGRLGRSARDLRRQYVELVQSADRVGRAEKRLEKLTKRADSVRPRRMDEARAALDDAQALLRIVEDKVLVAENRVRKLIVEEYPPKRQERLRERYLRRPERDGRPFSFG